MVGWPEGGPKGPPKGCQKNWFRLFFDPPGPIKLFLHSFSAWARGVCAHSDFFLKLSISQNIFKFYAKVAKSLGRNQIWWKTESTNFGHFWTWKVHCFEDVFIAMEVSSNLKIDVLKLQVTLGSNFMFVKEWVQKAGFFPSFLGQKFITTGFPILFNTL